MLVIVRENRKVGTHFGVLIATIKFGSTENMVNRLLLHRIRVGRHRDGSERIGHT